MKICGSPPGRRPKLNTMQSAVPGAAYCVMLAWLSSTTSARRPSFSSSARVWRTASCWISNASTRPCSPARWHSSAVSRPLPAVASMQNAPGLTCRRRKSWTMVSVFISVSPIKKGGIIALPLYHLFRYGSRMRPSVETVTTCHGRNLPLFCRAVRTACSMPPQQGTSMRTTVTLLISFCRMIAVSFSL